MLDRNDGGAWGAEPTGSHDVMVLRSTEQTANGLWCIGDPAYRSLSEAEHEATVLLEGDLLVTKSSGSAAHIGKTTIVDADLAKQCPGYSNFMQRLRVTPKQSPKFIWYVLNSDLAKIQINLESTTSTGLANLNGGLLGELMFPSPPMAEQTAIAAYLDIEVSRVDALISEKRALLDALADLKATRISEILTGAQAATVETDDPWLPRLPEGWILKRLKYLGQVRSGLAKGKKHDDDVITVELPYMRVANVQDGFIDLTNVSLMEVAQAEVERFSLIAGDVLMNEGGDYDKLGRGAVWQGEIAPCLHQNHVFSARLDDVEWAPWVAAITRTAYAKFYFMNNSKQSTNLASISQTNIKELPVAMPPASQRNAILLELDAELNRIDALVDHAEQELKLLAELRSSTITDAVLGRIDVRRHTKGVTQPRRAAA